MKQAKSKQKIIDKMEAMLTIQLAYDQKQDAGTYLNGAIESGVHGQPARISVKGDAGKMALKDIGNGGTKTSVKALAFQGANDARGLGRVCRDANKDVNLVK